MKLNLSAKLYLLFAAIFLATLVPVFAWVIPKMDSTLLQERKSMLKGIVSVAVGVMEYNYNLAKQGKQSMAEAKTRARETIRMMRYGPEHKDYLWINDMGPRMVMHPYVRRLEGKDLSKFRDKRGKLLFVEMVKVCRAKGGGFVRYMWQWKDDKTRIVPKLSYVQLFKPWGWIVGTGVYLEDLAQVGRGLVWGLIIMSLVVAVVLGSVGVMVTRRIAGRLQGLVERLGEVSGHVFHAADQTRESSQHLSSTSSQQAASLEETSSALEEIASMGRQNADNAAQAQAARREGDRALEHADGLMQQMSEAMEKIRRSGEETATIIKAIDEIAFQTNLLALNAAVEAARAGEAGAGFAVVAEEVRNLAQRAADAAKNTQQLIEETISQISRGVELVGEASQAFSELREQNAKIGAMVEEIAAAASEQAQGIEQINRAVAEMEKVVEQNAAQAQEGAAASEQLAEQARLLAAEVAKLKALVGGATAQA